MRAGSILPPSKTADALDRGILVGFGVLGQKLERMHRARPVAAHHIGESAAPVDPGNPNVSGAATSAIPGLPSKVNVMPLGGPDRGRRQPRSGALSSPASSAVPQSVRWRV